ncbi:MAG: hypothetical protein FD137_2057 [Spirochaetes bacterium]|nr:MAG: hypothetical protein FD137_2057 [Spirochaetota bacterium]
MDPEIKRRIDAALSRVKEPQSELPIVDLGLIHNINVNEIEKRIRLVLGIGTWRFQCPACSAINGVLKESITRRLREEFQAEFPDFAIEIE